jgi:iron complex transport system substrate-binding protein
MAPAGYGREITDMAGNKIQVPDKITRLFAPSPYGAYMMYAIAPDLMTGVMFAPKDADKKFLPKVLWDLPVLGQTGPGGGPSSNPEMIMKTKPDVLIMWQAEARPMNDRMLGPLGESGIPRIAVVATSLFEYPAAMRFLGQLTGREKRGELLAARSEKILADVTAAVKKVPADKKPKVYYAEGVDGLSTECNDSIHVQLFQILGDVDVHRCHTASHMGLEKISLEQVALYAPDVIVAQEKMFYDKVYQDPAWKEVKAVREHKVYLIPHAPLNWFDRPPSFMRFLGLEWLANKLYPKEFPIDIKQEAKSFYSTFLGSEPSDQDLQEIMPQ